MGQEGTHDLGALFEHHFDAVYGYVAYRVAPDVEAARDITQEVFLAAVQGLPAGISNGSAGTWLRSVARNKTADYFRTRCEEPGLPADDCETCVPMGALPGASSLRFRVGGKWI